MHGPKNIHVRAVIEIAFIIFLFYSNLLMGEFTRSAHSRTFVHACMDIVTAKNFAIAAFTASVGHLAFEFLRRKS